MLIPLQISTVALIRSIISIIQSQSYVNLSNYFLSILQLRIVSSLKTSHLISLMLYRSFYFFINQLQLNSMAHPNIKDASFVNQALRMGFTQQDLEPITMQKIIRNSTQALKQLSENERHQYLEIKFKALQDRQSKLILSVHQALTRSSDPSSRKGFNPVIKKLLEDHEIRLLKKARYDEKVRISKTRQAQHRKISNTIDLGRTSPNFSSSAKSSRVSKQSMRSRNSNSSGLSTSSHKDRLQLVRLKQQQAQRYKRSIFRYNQNESRKKVEKVQKSRLSLSRRLKTKSQISQQAVQQRKQQLVGMRHEEVRDHIEKLKYKMMKNQYIKQRQQEKKASQVIPYDSLYKRQLKNLFEQNQRDQIRTRYEQKIRSTQRKKREIEQDKKLKMKGKIKQQKERQLQALKFREHMTIQGQNKKQQTLYYEAASFERAKNKKYEIQSEKKMKLLAEKVKQEIVKSNYDSIQKKRRLESQAKSRQISEKLQEIKDIEDIKRKLALERKMNSLHLLQDQGQKFSFY